MSGISAEIDFRVFVGKIRYYLYGKAMRSVNDPGVREAIFEDIYDLVSEQAPVDTGALEASPAMNGGVAAMTGKSNYDNRIHYAHGDIVPRGVYSGIYWDPFSTDKKLGDIHYAQYVKFSPQTIINDSTQEIYDIVADHIIKEMNDDDEE